MVHYLCRRQLRPDKHNLSTLASHSLKPEKKHFQHEMENTSYHVHDSKFVEMIISSIFTFYEMQIFSVLIQSRPTSPDRMDVCKL